MQKYIYLITLLQQQGKTQRYIFICDSYVLE